MTEQRVMHRGKPPSFVHHHLQLCKPGMPYRRSSWPALHAGRGGAGVVSNGPGRLKRA